MRARVGKRNDMVRVAVRVPPETIDYLKEKAEQSGRSLNYEIVARLESSNLIDDLIAAKTNEEVNQVLGRLRRRFVGLRLSVNR